MVLLLKKKPSHADLRWQADQVAIANAKRAGSDTWVAPVPTEEIKRAALKRWAWHIRCNNPGQALPENFEPTGLTPAELNDWYWGLRCEAGQRFLKIVNQAYTKSEITRKQNEEGLEDVWLLLDPATKAACESVMKFLSD